MELGQVYISKSYDGVEPPESSDEIGGVAASCGMACAFSRQEQSNSDCKEREESTRRLFSLMFLYLVVMSVQIVGGLKSNSLAVITDAAHLLADVAGFSVSILAIKISSWDADPYSSYGFKRLEVLGALLSVQLIWLVSGVLIHEAVERLLSRTREVNGEAMFFISAFGFCVNLVMVMWLGHGHNDHHHHHHCKPRESEEETDLLSGGSGKSSKAININIQGAYLHVMADMIQSLGVMIGGAIIWAKPQWLVVDLICTLVFSAFALAATVPMLKNVFRILMESAPGNVDMTKLERGLRRINGVQDVHDLHVWEITVGRIVLSCHVLAIPGASPREILSDVRNYCRKAYGIHHVTVQVESA
ncbi:PREDICTED: metal tolerance protein B-like [Tarenaya hassleriana]|uniref:Ztp14 n=1 Tax=Tarenaya spinosa TaxID=228870 RepID=B2BXQ3_9ROSI|nr:PREDICTED: metal tolerance protein B-like [Tarenaya hassleriana]ABW81090.1 Ztp14 [Tarenaya spinosa]